MKTSCLFVLLIGWLFCSCATQSRPTKLAYYPRQYVVKVDLASQSKAEKGILYNLTDSTIVLAPMVWTKREMKTRLNEHGGALPSTELLLKTYRYTDISQLTLHRRGSVTKGFLIGAGVGVIGIAVSQMVFPKGFSMNFGAQPEPQITAFQGFVRYTGFVAITSAPGLLIGAAKTKRIKAKRQPIANEIKKRFRDYTIVEQINRLNAFK